MNKIDYISSIKEELNSKMHGICALFLATEDISDSPRWFNFKSFDSNNKILTIGSTQIDSLEFDVQADYKFIDTTRFWEQFRVYRTEFLENNYPEINTY